MQASTMLLVILLIVAGITVLYFPEREAIVNIVETVFRAATINVIVIILLVLGYI